MMKYNNLFWAFSVLSLLGCSSSQEVKTIPDSLSGIYPKLAYYNNEGECGTGAVVPWADRLWLLLMVRIFLKGHLINCMK